MGCTISFVCCEEEFLHVPVERYDEEKREGSRLMSESKISKHSPSPKGAILCYIPVAPWLQGNSVASVSLFLRQLPPFPHLIAPSQFLEAEADHPSQSSTEE
ncbi:hypothetical protein MHYP_G00356760 [Metynnis hypsauchen]